MAIRFIRGLTSTVLRNLTSLKHDAKRLQRRSVDVFGKQYPLSVCQTALAVSRGYESLSEFEKPDARVGTDRDAPFWTIQSRNDYHESVLQSLYALELDNPETAPVVFLGRPADALPVALVTLAEEMSQRKVPGLIMIETQEQTIQDCLIEDVAQRLGMSETLRGFRSLDLRERTLPVAISTEVRCWVNAIMNVLPADGAGELESSGWRAAIEHSIKAKAHGRRNTEKGEDDFHAVPFHPVKDGVTPLTVASHWPSWMQDDHLAFVETEIARTPPGISEPLRETVMKIVNDLYSRDFSAGRDAARESEHRPYVVLFSRNDPASVVLAAAVHSLFSWRYISSRSIRPMLFFSDGVTPYAPRFLRAGSKTLIVNGLVAPPPVDAGEWSGFEHALKVTASPYGVRFMGKRVRAAQAEPSVVRAPAEQDLVASLASIGIASNEIEKIIADHSSSDIRVALDFAQPKYGFGGRPISDPLAYFKEALTKEWSASDEAVAQDCEEQANPVHAEARELMRTLPVQLRIMFIAIRHMADFEEQRAQWVEAEEGLEVCITMLRSLGRPPSVILDELMEHKLCLRRLPSPPGIRVLLSHAAGALLKGEV
jgi:hypothetical protein